MNREELTKLYIISQKGYGNTISSINEYLRHINKFFDNIDVEPLNVKRLDIKNYLNGLDLSSSTKHLILSSINGFYLTMIDCELTEYNPAYNIKLGKTNYKPRRALNDKQIQGIMRVQTNDRDRSIFSLLSLSGLRISELCNLTLAQYKNRDEDNKILITSKGNKTAYIYIANSTIELIDKYLENRKESKLNYLFLSNQNTKLDRISLSRHWKNSARKCGMFTEEEIGNFSNHTLRHTACGVMFENTNDIVACQTLLRHNSVDTTRRYLDYNDKRISSVMKELAI